MAVTVHEGTTFLVSDERGDFEPGSDGGLIHLRDIPAGGARIDVSLRVKGASRPWR